MKCEKDVFVDRRDIALRRYFNHAHVGPLSDDAISFVNSWLMLAKKLGPDSVKLREIILDGLPQDSQKKCAWAGLNFLYRDLASLIGTSRENVALLPTFSEGIRLALDTISSRNRRINKILISDMEHPTVVNAVHRYCQAFGADLKVANSDKMNDDWTSAKHIDVLKQNFDAFRPDVVFFTHIDYRSGTKIDLGSQVINEIGDKCAIVIDVAHSIGQTFIEDTSFDFHAIGSGHKWLGGIRSSAFYAFRGRQPFEANCREALSDLVHCAFTTLTQMRDTPDFDWGSVCELPYLSLGYELRQRLTQDSYQKKLQSSDIFFDQVRSKIRSSLIDKKGVKLLQPDYGGFGIFNLKFAKTISYDECLGRLEREEFKIGSAHDTENELRISVSLLNEVDDLDRLLELI